MKISTALFITGLMIFPVIGLAQTSEIQATSIQPATTVTSPKPTAISPAQTTETTVPQTSITTTSEKPAEPVISELPVSTSAPKSTTPGVSTPTNTVSSSLIKCGVIDLKVCNECGLGVYKNVHVQCSDGSEITLGEATSCKPVDLW
ncbi:MAG: hypothetical protein Q7S75_00695, partial [bacterium]|nr:hypothetical protein [bacterium]